MSVEPPLDEPSFAVLVVFRCLFTAVAWFNAASLHLVPFKTSWLQAVLYWEHSYLPMSMLMDFMSRLQTSLKRRLERSSSLESELVRHIAGPWGFFHLECGGCVPPLLIFLISYTVQLKLTNVSNHK